MSDTNHLDPQSPEEMLRLTALDRAIHFHGGVLKTPHVADVLDLTRALADLRHPWRKK